MAMHISHRIKFMFAAVRTIWFPIVAVLWSMVSFYDTALSEVIPEDWAKNMPKLFGFLALVSHWISLSGWAIFFLLLIMVAILEHAVKLQRIYEKENLELRKIDWADLEKLAFEKYIGNTFLYNNSGDISARFVGKFEIAQLRESISNITVRAPKGSIAHILFTFNAGRQGVSDKFTVYYYDSFGAGTKVENIYDEVNILLNNSRSFGLKIVYGDDCDIVEGNEFRVITKGWTK